MNQYEALLALNTRGKEETVKETIERLEKRDLAYETRHLKSAYFINVVFSAKPATIAAIRAKLALDNEVVLQNYLKLPAKKAAEAVAA